MTSKEHSPQTLEAGEWVAEEISDFLEMRYRVTETLFSEKTPYQTVEIFQTAGHGKMLMNDRLVMLTERDEFSYHEMIAHVPLYCHPHPERVLVIGGGDGGTVREALKHRSVQHVDLVEIDEAVVRACKEYIPLTASCLDDPKVSVYFQDAVQYVAESKERYDVVLVDSTDPIGPATPLFGEDFYRNVENLLSDEGIVVSQAESAHYELKTQKTLLHTLNAVFPRVHIYNYNNLTYPGGLWSLSYASKAISPTGALQRERIEEAGLELKYYSEAVHRAAFVLPEFMRKELSPFLTPL